MVRQLSCRTCACPVRDDKPSQDDVIVSRDGCASAGNKLLSQDALVCLPRCLLGRAEILEGDPAPGAFIFRLRESRVDDGTAGQGRLAGH